LVVATSKNLAKAGCAGLQDCLHARLNEELVAIVCRHNSLKGVLKVLGSNVEGLDNRVTSLLNADRWAFTTKVLDLGDELSLAELSGITDGTADGKGISKDGLGKGLIRTIRLVTSVRIVSPALDWVVPPSMMLE